jgi:hypothetical protein
VRDAVRKFHMQTGIRKFDSVSSSGLLFGFDLWVYSLGLLFLFGGYFHVACTPFWKITETLLTIQRPGSH